MASGPSAPPAAPADSRPVASVRPGALLTAAAAPPLGAAVLYASGWLAWGPRLALGVAVIVLGNALRGTIGTVTGARIGAPVARAVGVAFMVGGLLIVLGAALTALGVARSPAADEVGDDGAFGLTLALWAVPVVGLVATTIVALGLRRPAALRAAQELGTACAVVAGLGTLVVADRVAGSGRLAAGEPVLEGVGLVAMVLLVVALLLGTVLLAVSATRWPSRIAVGGAAVGIVGVALGAATLSVASASGLDVVPTDHGAAATLLRPLDLLLGFGDPGRLLHAAEPGWPVIFGVVGVVLLGAAAWLESRMPLPADAPVAPPRDV